MIKKLFKYSLIFSLTLLVLLGLLILVAKIPQSAIKENVRESASYYCDTGLFVRQIEGVNGSAIDHYADSILVAIAYQYDEDKPLTSVMWSSYYFTAENNENVNLLMAVENDLEANQQYLRYWHGSNVVVRPLLAIFKVQEIYVVNAVVIGALVIVLITILVLKRAYVPAVAIGLGLVSTQAWFVPGTFEYTWNFIIMLIMSIVGVSLGYKDKWSQVGALFLVGGMVTNYFDFLSTETITLTIPLLLLLWIRDKNSCDKERKDICTFTLKNVALWSVGYVGMWLSKWIIAAIVLGENTLPYVTGHVAERIGGDVGLNTLQCMYAALARNIRCLLPLEYGVTGVFVGVGLFVLALFVGYVYYGKKEDKRYILIYLLIALVPYVRYVVLHNHAYLHYFFTYRAQIATVVAVIFILELLTDRRWLSRGRKGRKKRA